MSRIVQAVSASALLAVAAACNLPPSTAEAPAKTSKEPASGSSGDEARVTVDGEALPQSTVVPDDGPKRVPSYKARGNEPGWQLTIADGAVQLVTDYGATTIDAPISDEQRTAKARTIVANTDSGPVQIDISPGGCIDNMSGDRYADTVTVTGDKLRLTGCGGAHWLRDITWRLLSMNGDQAVGSEELTVEFRDGGRVSGYAGCNRYNGSYSLEGGRLAINPAIAATKRGCRSEQLMQQETRFLMALPGMKQASTDGDGNLVLVGGAGARLVFRNADDTAS